MKCFRHPAIDALGICKACCKGLCHECSVETGGQKFLVCKLSCEKVLLRTDSLRSGMMALMGLALFVVAVSAIDVLGVPTGLLCLAGGVTLMATSLRELWISRKIQTTNQISLNLNHELLDTDKLDHEFKRLESESKQTKDLE